MISRFRRHFSKNNAEESADTVSVSDPHAAVRHAMREVDKAVDDLSNSYAAAAGRRIEAERQRKNLTAHIVKLDEKARLALGQNRDDLASAIIAQQIGYEKELADWNATLEKADGEVEQLRTEVASLKMRKVDLQDQLLRDLQAEQQVADAASSDLERDMLNQRVASAVAAYDEAIAPAPIADDTLSAPMMIDDEVQARMDMLRQETGGTASTI